MKNQQKPRKIPMRPDNPQAKLSVPKRAVPRRRSPENPVGSNRDKFNTAKVIHRSLKRPITDSNLKPASKNNSNGQNETKFSKIKPTKAKENKKITPWEKERLKGAKVYRLTAFTTTDNIDKKFASYRRQAAIRKVLVTLIIILTIITIIGKYFDFSNTGELDRITGINEQVDED